MTMKAIHAGKHQLFSLLPFTLHRVSFSISVCRSMPVPLIWDLPAQLPLTTPVWYHEYLLRVEEYMVLHMQLHV